MVNLLVTTAILVSCQHLLCCVHADSDARCPIIFRKTVYLHVWLQLILMEKDGAMKAIVESCLTLEQVMCLVRYASVVSEMI